MASVKAVLDTNVIVSAFLKPDGLEALIFDLAEAGEFTLVVSGPVFGEYEEVLRRPEFGFTRGMFFSRIGDGCRSQGNCWKNQDLGKS